MWTSSFPDKGSLAYLWDWVCQIGIDNAKSFAEVKAWSDLMGITPTPDESTAIVEIARMWVTENIRGREKDAFPPWLPE